MLILKLVKFITLSLPSVIVVDNLDDEVDENVVVRGTNDS